MRFYIYTTPSSPEFRNVLCISVFLAFKNHFPPNSFSAFTCVGGTSIQTMIIMLATGFLVLEGYIWMSMPNLSQKEWHQERSDEAAQLAEPKLSITSALLQHLHLVPMSLHCQFLGYGSWDDSKSHPYPFFSPKIRVSLPASKMFLFPSSGAPSTASGHISHPLGLTGEQAGWVSILPPRVDAQERT